MQAPRKIAVAGATGRVGRHIVDVLEDRGHDVVVMSRSSGVDVATGQGLAEALAGVDCIIDASSHGSPDEKAATEFFVADGGEVTYLPKMRLQPVAALTVAQALADMATSAPAPRASGAPIPEIAGPKEEHLVALASSLVARRGDPVRIQEVSNPDDPDSDLYASGALLPGPHATLAGPTFAAWLDATYGRSTAAPLAPEQMLR